VDMAEGLARVGGNKKLYRKLLIKLRDDYAQARAELEGLTQKGEAGEAERLAHTVKGVAGNVGAKGLAAAAAVVEKAVREGQDGLADKLEAFGGELAKVVEALGVLGEAAGAPPAQPGKAAASPQELAAALEEMLPHLRTKKPKPSKEAINKLKELGWPVEMGVEFSDLSKLIGKYKFKDALPLAEGLLAKLKG